MKATKVMQNKHIAHPEDSILTGDLSVLDWFTDVDSIIIGFIEFTITTVLLDF